MKRAAAGAVLVSLFLAGCGSTVQVRSTAGVAGPDGLGGPVATDGGLSGTTGGTTGAGPVGSGTALSPGTVGTTSAGGTTGFVAQPSQATTTAGGGTGASAPAITSAQAPIKIGVITQQQLDEAAKAFGLDGVTTGDTRKQVEAVLAWIKANGGLGGHPVQLYEYPVNLADGSNDAVMQNACTAMTQDYKVRFVITVLASLQVLAECLSKHGVGLLADNTNFGDETMRRYEPILGNPSEMGQGRMVTTLIDNLVERGWLSATTTKVGLLVLDSRDGHATVDGPLTAALRKHGLKSLHTEYVNPNTGDGGSSQSGSAVLRFRAAHVDRVIPVMYSPLYMMTAAESQGYRPAYAMVSAMGPGALLEGLAPANQLKNAAGIGWAPFLDIGKGPKPPPVNARATLCFDLMRKGGQAATSALIKGFQAQVCDMMMYLNDVADLKPAIPGDIFTSGRLALGTRFVSPATYRVDVTKRTAGVAGFRPLAYLGGCECFQYVGPVVAAP